MKHDFISLYDDCFEDVYRYIYFKTNNKWDTDDITSDVFKRAFEKFDTVNGSPKAWLFTIVRNSLTDYYRRKKFISIDESPDAFIQTDGIETDIENRDILDVLKKSLAALPEDELEIIKLRYFSNLKYREIGELTGKNEGFVKTKSSRIIKKLRIMVNKYLGGIP